MPAPDDPHLGDRLIDAVAAASPPTPGRRALHAKGVGIVGRFRSSGAAASRSTAAHLQAETDVPVTGRFSNGSAAVQADGIRDGRGFAVRFHLADGASTDIVALTLPVFFVRTTDDFVALMEARRPDPATGEMDLNAVFAFLGEHPEAQRAVELSMSAPLPAGYTTVPYHSVHAFWLVGPDGRRTAVRYRWDPAEPATLPDDDAAGLDPDYLGHELGTRLGTGAATFRLVLRLAGPGDVLGDPTAEWAEDGEEIVAGELAITGLAPDPAAIEAAIFDPTRVTTGIECSDDPILHARSVAYGASYSRRTARS